MDRYQTRIEAAYLVECSSQAAYDWLHENRQPDGEEPPILDEFPKVIEYLLVRRNDSLIDLGIARFGKSITAIKRVVKRGNLGVRCAALSNPHIGPAQPMRLIGDGWLDENGLKELIRSGCYAELQAFARNPFLDDTALEHLLEKKEEFAELSENQYLHMLMWLGGNPRMSKSYDDRILDGWAEYSHGRVFSLAWELARTLPADQLRASALYELLRKTSLPVSYKEPETVIARWRIEEERDDEKHSLAYSYFLRSRIADTLKPDASLLNSDDFAVRESFYRRFEPSKFEDWPKFVERDGEEGFVAIVENDRLWRSDDNRRRLSDLAWEVPDPHSGMNAPNALRWAEERKRREHPDWFRDEDEEYSSSPNAIIRRLEKKIDKISESMGVDSEV